MIFINIGFYNLVDASKIVGISKPSSAPIRRMINKAKEAGRYIDFTEGKKTRSIIFSECGGDLILIASSINNTVILDRIRKEKNRAVQSSEIHDLVESE